MGSGSMSAPQSVQEMVYKSNQLGGQSPHHMHCSMLGFIGQNVLSPLFGYANTKIKMCYAFRPFITTKANLSAGKYTFSYSPRTRTRNPSNRNPSAPPRPRRPLPRKDIYATLASTLAHPMDAEQYYQCVNRELPANHATLQGWRQEEGGDKEWGPEDDLLWEDTMDTFLEEAASGG